MYEAEITPSEYVMRGNAAIIKCLIPSFVADFVHVVAWINEDGDEIINNGNFIDGKLFGWFFKRVLLPKFPTMSSFRNFVLFD